ncbi:uncharacterized protein [Rhodnius prolixus]|uniref:uncharacterized protein n=1 Tax=Rhodnius prolixus TaxID=13249 RepID=UPI003D187B35
MVVSREDLARADASANEGHSVRYIAQDIGEPRSTIHDGLQRLRTTGSLDRREVGEPVKHKTILCCRFATSPVIDWALVHFRKRISTYTFRDFNNFFRLKMQCKMCQ